MAVEQLIASLKSHASVDTPLNTAAQLAQLEEAHRCHLPEDFKELYQAVGGARIFKGRYELLRLDDIASVGLLQGGELGRLSCSPSWLAFMDVQDGNYVAVDTNTGHVL